MYAKINTCILEGLEGHIIEVEVDLSRGLPQFNIVGLPDTSIKESQERVRTAIKNSGYIFPLNRITVNLAPANLRKSGSQLDLAIGVSILKANGDIGLDIPSGTLFIGELFLDGRINKVDGALPMIISMRDKGIKTCIVPYDNRDECVVVSDMEIIPVRTIHELVAYLNGDLDIPAYKLDMGKIIDDEFLLDYAEMKGQVGFKRALEIAAAGFHNMLIIGPPGSGKTMAAKRLPSIMPKLNFEEAIDVTKIYSVSGLLENNRLMQKRPFRSPHHTASAVSLIGGGRIPRPGEISLAHNGVLFLDEMPEFSKQVLEVLRQPLEDGEVTIARSNATLTYPSTFMLVGSMNPCPCGHLGNPLQECTCTQNSIEKYLRKISGPLLDRIDIHVEVAPVDYDDLRVEYKEESSESIRKRVNKARKIQNQRFEGTNVYSNSQIRDRDILEYCRLGESSEKIMKIAFDRYNFSARTYNKLLKVARTIADLDGREEINDEDILEAIRYRTSSNKYWRY